MFKKQEKKLNMLRRKIKDKKYRFKLNLEMKIIISEMKTTLMELVAIYTLGT